MVNDDILKQMNSFEGKAKGWKLSGAGGGGYIILINDEPIENAIQIRIRRG